MSSESQSFGRASLAAILYVGYDTELLAERVSALRRAGYDVHPTGELAKALSQLRQQPFDALVIGHRIPERERERLVDEIRKRQAKTKIVLLYRDSIRHAECAHALSSIDNGPLALVQTLDRLLGQEGDRK